MTTSLDDLTPESLPTFEKFLDDYRRFEDSRTASGEHQKGRFVDDSLKTPSTAAVWEIERDRRLPLSHVPALRAG